MLTPVLMLPLHHDHQDDRIYPNAAQWNFRLKIFKKKFTSSVAPFIFPGEQFFCPLNNFHQYSF
jgi:hypothetical protein